MVTSANAESQTAKTSPTVSSGHFDESNCRQADGTDEEKKSYEVTKLDESDDPKNMSLSRKWIAVFTIGSASTCAACASSIVRADCPFGASLNISCCSQHSFAETGVENTFHISEEIAILGITLFVLGLGIACVSLACTYPTDVLNETLHSPLLVGPLSEMYGRSPVYIVSFSLFFIFSFPVAFAPDIGISRLRGPGTTAYVRGSGLPSFPLHHRHVWSCFPQCGWRECE